MPGRKRGNSLTLSAMMAELSFASFEVIARRTAMMATGTCSAAEYQRMMNEKAAAAASTALRFVSSAGHAPVTSLLSPWHSRAKANAERLRHP